MIINLRGTSGSGKTTVVKNFMDLAVSRNRVLVKGRDRPIGYSLKMPWQTDRQRTFVLGHYETDCGGCDTISSTDEVFDRVRAAHGHGMDVLFEGLLIAAEVKRTMALFTDGLPLLVIALDTDIESCVLSVNKRRAEAWRRRVEETVAKNQELRAKGKKEFPLPPFRGTVNPANTESKHKATVVVMERLAEAGLRTEWQSRETALGRITEEFENATRTSR